MKLIVMMSLLGAMLLSSLLYAQNDPPLGDVARQSKAASALLRKNNPKLRPPLLLDGSGRSEAAKADVDSEDENTVHDPDSPEGIVDRGLELEQNDKVDEALVLYERALALRPNYGRAYYDIGVAKGRKRDYKGAIEAYKTAILLNYDAFEGGPYRNLAIALNRIGRYKEVEEVVREGVEKFPNNCCLLPELGYALVEQRKFEEAIACYRKMLSIDPTDLSARQPLYLLLVRLGRQEEANSLVAEWDSRRDSE